jgi:trans-2,3-dihydro-3-hydroxyanthranilate isomerase
MTEIHIQQWDAFADQPFKGNPAAVVCHAEGLPDDLMQKIAREMNLSETAFVTPSDLPNHRFRYRWFTPALEVDFCGHATLAATFALCDQGMVELPYKGVVSFNVETKIGTLELTIDCDSCQVKCVWIGAPIPTFDSYEGEPLWEFLAAMGLGIADLDPTLEPWAANDRHMLFVPLKSLDLLGSLQPDFRKLAHLGNGTGLSVVPFSLETLDPKNRVHLRFFGPCFGIDEDPVTGAANSPLGVLLFKQGVITHDISPSEYIAEQGDFVNRTGRIYVRVHHKDGSPTAVQIGGPASKVMEGTLIVNI